MIEYWKDEMFPVHNIYSRQVQGKGVIEFCLMASSAALRVRSLAAYSLCSPQRRMSVMHALINGE